MQKPVPEPQESPEPTDSIVRLESLDAPTADIDQMLSEIDAGRR
jgi:hypothetical protein